MFLIFFSGGENNWKVVNNEISLGGKSYEFTLSEDLKEQVQHYNISKEAEKYYKIRKNKITYCSVQYKRATKTVNYVAELTKDCSRSIVEIQFFIYDQDRVYLCGKEIPRKTKWCIVKEWDKSRLIRVDKESRLVSILLKWF